MDLPDHMTPEQRAKLEDAFFAEQDTDLVDRLRARREREAAIETLKRVAPDADPAILDKLVDLGIDAGTLAALALIPLVEVAWADGHMDTKEREAILKAAHDYGIHEGTDEHRILEGWLTHEAGGVRLRAWLDYTRSIMGSFTDEEREGMRERTLNRMNTIAKAAGGLLGIGTVAKAEKDVMDEIAAVFEVSSPST